MRIASTQYHTTMNMALQQADQRRSTILQQMASGQRLQQPSDDPIAQVRLLRLGREEAAIDQYRANIGMLSLHSEENETYLNGIVNDSLQARDLLVWALDGANVPDDLKAMASSIDALRASIYQTANSRDQEGRYVFSGTNVTTQAITYDPAQPPGSRYTFTGNASTQEVSVTSNVTQPANVSLHDGAAPNSSKVVDLLNVLDQVGGLLGGGTVNINDPATRSQVTDALNAVDAGLDSVNGKIARLGGQRNILQTLENTLSDISLSNQTAVLTIGQLDYGDAAVKLNGYTIAVQATLKAYSQVSKLSLFDAL